MNFGNTHRTFQVSDLVFESDSVLLIGVNGAIGSGQGAFSLVKLNQDGDEIWTRKWKTKNYGPGIYTIGILPNKEYYLVGSYYTFALPNDVLIVIDQDGTLLRKYTYNWSTTGHYAVGTRLKDGNILIRRTGIFTCVDPNTGAIVWTNWPTAHVWNHTKPIETEDGFMVLGQSAQGGPDIFSPAVPEFFNQLGIWQSQGDHIRINGNGQYPKNLDITRVERLSDGSYITVSTDSLANGHLELIHLSDQGQLLSRKSIQPDSSQYRFLHHDFCLLADSTLAITAHVNGKLAVLKVPLDLHDVCGTNEREAGLYTPYGGDTGSSVPNQTPNQFDFDSIAVAYTSAYFDPNPKSVCDNDTQLANKETKLSACEGDSILLDATDQLATAYLWQNGVQNAQAQTLAGVAFICKVRIGCQSYLHKFITEAIQDCPCTMEFPNAFSPNGDDNNDNFKIIGDCQFTSYHLTIFNRSGTLIFETQNPTEGWNGTVDHAAAPIETYFYCLDFRINKPNSQVEKTCGELSLLR